MNDQHKTKAQLIKELEQTRGRIAELVPKQADERLHDLIEIIQFTEHVSAKLHGLVSEAEIFRTVKEEFAQSKRYTTSIVLLTDDDSSLRIAEVSLSPAKVKAGEKATGLRLKGYKIDLKKSSTYRQVVREGKTVQVSADDITGELFARPLAHLVIKALGLEKESSILTPLKRHGKIIGAFALTAPEHAEHFIPTVRNLAQHISNALEWADEYSQRERAEEALRDNEEKYRTIVENVSDQIIHMNKYGTIIYANDKEEIFGRKPEEIIGKNFTELGYFDLKDIPKYLKLFKDVITSKKKFNELELEIKHKNGHIIPIEVSTSLVKKDGKTVGFVCITRDITDRKRAEEALRESEEKFRSLFNNMRNGFAYCQILVDEKSQPIDFIYLEVNDAFESLTGLRKVDVTGKRVTEAIPGIREAHPELFDIYGKVAATGESTQFEIYFKPLKIWLLISVYSPYKGYFVAIFENITERKQAEEALRESEGKYRAIFEQAADSIVLIDAETGELTEFNDRTHENLGYARGEFAKLKIPDFEVIESAEEIAKHIEKITKEGSDTFETKHKTKEGEIRDILVNSRAISIHGKDFVMSIWRDITNRRQAEEALRMERDKLRNIFEAMDDGVYMVNKDYDIEYVNPVLIADFGPYEGRKCHDYFHDREEVCPWCKNQDVFAGNTVRWEWYSFKNGKTYDLIDTPMSNVDGTISKLEIFRDITDRKRAEEELHQYEHIVSSSTDMLALLDRNFVFLAANAAYLKAFDKTPDELIGHSVSEVYGEESFETVIKPNAERCLAGEEVNYQTWCEFPAYKQMYMDITYYPYTGVDNEIKGFAVNRRDITERKQVEDELMESREQLRNLSAHLQSVREESQKLLAREIHDELGQDLTALKMDLSWLKGKLRQDQELLREKAADMTDLANTMIQTVKRISTRLRPALLDDLGVVAAIEWEMGEFEKRAGIGCELTVEPEEIDIDPDRATAIYRIFQEALTNIARHAQATNVKASLKLHTDMLGMEIRDNGIGITEEQIANPKSFGIIGIRERVLQWDGEATIKGREGKGTTLAVTIPLDSGEGHND